MCQLWWTQWLVLLKVHFHQHIVLRLFNGKNYNKITIQFYLLLLNSLTTSSAVWQPSLPKAHDCAPSERCDEYWLAQPLGTDLNPSICKAPLVGWNMGQVSKKSRKNIVVGSPLQSKSWIVLLLVHCLYFVVLHYCSRARWVEHYKRLCEKRDRGR